MADTGVRRAGARLASLLGLGLLVLLSPLGAASATSGGTLQQGPARSSGPIGVFANNIRVQTTDCLAYPEGRRVLIVGDSITARTAPATTAAFAARGWGVCVDAVPGQPTASALDRYPDGFPEWADVVVMATGTNDIFGAGPAGMPAQVLRARGMGRPLVWVDVWVNRLPKTTNYRYNDLYNTVLVNRALTGVTVVDWYGFLARKATRQAAYLTDGVHPSTTGGKALAALILSRVLS